MLISTAEFALKSQPVRQQLARLLKRHIRFNLKRIGGEHYRIMSVGGFLVVDHLSDAEPVANSLSRILGVSHADACARVATELSEIIDRVAEVAKQTVKHEETFAVRARRFEPSQLKGKEIEIRAGSEILSRLPSGVKVNLDSPNHTFRVFYGASDAYISARRFNGPGGLPVGSQGSLLGLATDATHAPLAFYLLMKRGAIVWPVIAELPLLGGGGVSSDRILEGLKRLRPYVPKNRYQARLIMLDENTRQALASVRPDIQRAFCMRLMFRAVKHLSRTALGLVTADRFGQAGVRTLKDLRVVDEIATFPVYRPLLTLDDAYMRQQLEESGLAQVATGKAVTEALPRPHEDLIEEVRTLENRLRAEQLAQNMVADARKIEIDFP